MNLMPPPTIKPSNLGKTVPLGRGKGLAGWIARTNSGEDLAKTGGKLIRVTESELRKHATEESCWIILNGKVYNVTAYLEYHPGGVSEIMRAAGNDGTDLFNEIHPWVNAETMLKGCLVGPYDGSFAALTLNSGSNAGNNKNKPSTSSPLLSVGNDGSNKTDVKSLYHSDSFQLRGEWKVDKEKVELRLCHGCGVENDQKSGGSTDVGGGSNDLRPNVILEFPFPSQLKILIRPIRQPAVCFLYDLPSKVVKGSLSVESSSQIIKIYFRRDGSEKERVWTTLLKPTKVSSPAPVNHRKMEIVERTKISRNGFLYRLKCSSSNAHFSVLPGHHVYIRIRLPDGSTISKPYTPIPPLFANEGDTNLSANDATNQLYFLIKVYPQGPLTSRLDLLQIGDEVDVSDPEGTWYGDKLDGGGGDSSRAIRYVVMLAAGTGITPMLSIYSRLDRKRKYHLITFDKSADEQMMAKKLAEVADEKEGSNLRVTHVLSSPADNDGSNLRNSYCTGRVSLRMIERILETAGNGDGKDGSGKTTRKPDDKDIYWCVCGPRGFNDACLQIFESLGFKNGIHYHVFQ